MVESASGKRRRWLSSSALSGVFSQELRAEPASNRSQCCPRPAPGDAKGERPPRISAFRCSCTRASSSMAAAARISASASSRELSRSALRRDTSRSRSLRCQRKPAPCCCCCCSASAPRGSW